MLHPVQHGGPTTTKPAAFRGRVGTTRLGGPGGLGEWSSGFTT